MFNKQPKHTEEEFKRLESACHILCIFEDNLITQAEKDMKLKNLGVKDINGELKIVR